MGLQREVVISHEGSLQRTTSHTDMEESPVHESSLLDEQREEIQESLVDLFERFIIPQMSHVIYKVDTKHHGLEDDK